MIRKYVTKGLNSGNGDCFASISQALDSISKEEKEPIVITLAPGIYHEKLEIRRPSVTLEGEGAPEETVIEFGDFAYDLMPDGSKRGTFRSYVCLLDGDGCSLRNLTIRNTAAPRSKVGQAIALYADGDGILVENCHLESFQDTLFTGPLPPYALSPGGFTGPKEFDERRMGRQIYRNCVISGDVDFIFGSASVYFKDCEIISRNAYTQADQAPERGIIGYVTAASTPEGWPVGYVFEDCRFTSKDCPPGSVYLGRPWRDYAKTVLIHCDLGAHVHPAGFHDWGKEKARDTIFYGEFGCTGIGADRSMRAPYVKALGEDEAKAMIAYFAGF
ncbi:MAG: pectin methylesterase [Acetatifactor sp.]|nr:pectin methylesterase [Acetatifactor sp.]